MSGIGGIVHLDHRPLDPDQTRFLAAALTHRGPDGVGCWTGDGIAMVQALLRATPDAGPPAPAADPSGRFRMTFDGRIDNRDDLVKLLGEAGPQESDAALVLRAYQRWGPDCVRKLLGDFAFAVWDGESRRLFCARDPLGVKPFVYRVDGRTMAWASEMAPLVNLPGTSRTPNPGMVAEFLANEVTSLSETVWEGVLRLPPGHSLTVADHQVRVARYWDLDPAKEIRHASHGDYAEHLREILTAAVRCRMRTVGPFVTELSGGIDSSAILGMAVAEAGGTGGIEAVSLVYPGQDCDESWYIDTVARHTGVAPVKVTPIPAGSFDYAAHALRTADVPAYAASGLWDAVYAAARHLGATSIVDGVGGDEWFRGTEVYIADLLRAGRLTSIPALAREGARERQSSPTSIFIRHGVRSLVVHSLPLHLIDRLRVQTAARRSPWVRPEFATSVGLGRRLAVPPREGLRTIAQGQICTTVDGGTLTGGYEFAERMMSYTGLELRMPFMDVRLVEFALAIPEAERWGTHRPKRVLRTAIRGLAPDVVVDRLDKQGPGFAFVDQLLLPETAALLEHPAIEREGWVDGDLLRAKLAEVVAAFPGSGPRWHPNCWPLWRAVSVEMWLRAHGLG